MFMSKFLKEAPTLFREMDNDLPSVPAIACAHHQAAALGAVDQLHGAMVFQLQALRQMSDGGLVLAGQASDGQQKLILLGMQSRAPRRRLAEVQETAYLVAELGLRDEFRVLCTAGV
jgi:hypothetical protein